MWTGTERRKNKRYGVKNSTVRYLRAGALADRAGRRILTLGQAVDLVVEQDDLQVDVAADHVHQVVAADRKPVAVTGDHPHLQVRPAGLDTRGDRRGF